MTKYFLINNRSIAAAYGIGTYVEQMIEIFRDNTLSYELSFIDINTDINEFSVDKDQYGLLHYVFPSHKGSYHLSAYYRYILYILSLYIKDDEEVIFHFNYCQYIELISLIKANYKNCRVYYTIHYLRWCFILNGNLTHFRRIINKVAENETEQIVRSEYEDCKHLLALSDKVIVLSKFTYNLILTDYKISNGKIHLVYNGIKESPSIVPYNGYTECTTKDILFVGRLDEVKGVEYLIKAFKILLTHGVKAKLTLVGDGDFSRYLALCDGVWDKVTFTGKIAKKDVEKFYNCATIGVLPSFNEQCSYSAIEMMAHGLPFIATDSTGLEEMMDFTPDCLVHIDEENFQPNKFTYQLAEKMELILSNSVLRKQCSHQLYQLYRKRYTFNCMKDAMVNLLNHKRRIRNFLSQDFIPYLDNEAIRLINCQPVLDLDNIGLTGIGCYLWWRIKTLKNSEDAARRWQLQEYLIYYIDWLFDVVNSLGKEAISTRFEEIPLNWLLNELKTAGFYPTKVYKIYTQVLSFGISLDDKIAKSLDEIDILQTMLKIYNLQL
ncbi:hypothetical protein PRBRB14_18050 [Hallella multisaccharivorax DSM 17128]|uniref:Glycosyl transferase group 1 n=1 Tax=Hallella multisaccharivorax DSM 17128 TaxID=688246 RepID=F8N9Z2_9BACT|nr:glycosyltransferase [Hallella multisaccharivorax]EGN57809.1 glycosyl transferase group 1 [Hallella multisaccharivorax DSM 17128]GJG30926.1 hypothetical protein PRBRB14_18050 [Hallella multisaccharivorax DSM 17128]